MNNQSTDSTGVGVCVCGGGGGVDCFWMLAGKMVLNGDLRLFHLSPNFL